MKCVISEKVHSIGEDTFFTHVHCRGYKDFKKSSCISVATIEGHAALCRTYELVILAFNHACWPKKKRCVQGI